MKKYAIYLLLLVMVLLLGSTMFVRSAIQQIAGLAVAQTATRWNNVQDGSAGDDLTEGLIAVTPMVYDGTNFDRPRGDIANGIDVDVTRISGTTTTAGDNTPADGYTNPTDALDVHALNAHFNGTTWDRVYHSFSQSVAGITTDAGGGTSVDMSLSPMNDYVMVIDRTAGATDVVEIDLECSIDNSIFSQIETITSLATEPAFINKPDVPCNYMRYNVVTVGAGNTITVQLLATK